MVKHLDAVRLLREGADFPDLVEAIATISQDPDSRLDELLLGLDHPGVIREQAALALYERTGRPVPRDTSKMDLSREGWKKWLADEMPASRFSNRVAGTLSQLSREERLVAVLYYFEKMNFAEIASVIGQSESRAAEIHARLLETLRKSFADDARPIADLFHDVAA